MTAASRLAIASTDPRVQAAWREYVEAVDRGESIEVERFLAGHPDAADELRSLIAFDEEARRLMGGASPKGDLALAQTIPPKVPKAEVSTHSVAGKVVDTSAIKQPSPAQAGPPGKAMEASMARRSLVATPPKPPLPKSANDLPDSFGRYQVKQKLGEGAMGAVYLAVDSLLQRKVALKTPTFDDDTDGELLKRFHREARAVANLKHPNLCAVYDVGEIDGRHYISMEFVPGKKLQEFIKADKPMTEKQAMAVVRKIALAMQEAHAHGVIHRDLKPDNIMVNEKGEPVVMDFGLVHKTDQQNSTVITQRGTLIGSPAYMSKEQVEGDPDKLTGATDQYSLGVVLYQLLTSKLPFEGGIHAVLGAILVKEPPPPSEHRPDLNPHLEVVCLKMMAKEAKDRYPSMKAAADALAGVARGTSTTAGASLVARPKGGASDAALETTLEPAASREGANEFDFNAPNEPRRRRKSSRRDPSLPPNSKRIGGVAAAFVLLAAVIWFNIGDSRVKVEILADGYEVKFNEAEITITDGTRETKVKPGDHTLHIKSSKPGDDGNVDEFDTEQLTLKKGGKPVLIVTREDSEVVVKLDGTPVPRKSLTVSTTGQSNVATTKEPESIDLLKWIDLKRDVVTGTAKFNADRLIVEKGTAKQSKLQIPVLAPNEYRLTLEFKKISADTGQSFNIGIPVGERQSMVVIDAFGKYTGLETIDGKDLIENGNKTESKTERIVVGQPAVIQIDVRRGHISATLNQNPIVYWMGDFSRLGLLERWLVPNSRSIVLGSSGFPFEVQKFTLTPLPASPTPTFDEWDLAKPLGQSQWTTLDGGVLYGSGAGWLATKQDYSDFELSLEYELPSGGNSGVFVRVSPTGKPDGTGFVGIQLLDDNAPANASSASVLRTGSLWNIETRKRPLNTTPNQWHTLVVRAVGPRIQVTHDGTDALDTDLNSVTIPPTIKRQPSGRIGLQTMTTAGARFRNITIRDLTKPANSETSNANQASTAGSSNASPANAPRYVSLVGNDAPIEFEIAARLMRRSDLESSARPPAFYGVAIRAPFVYCTDFQHTGSPRGDLVVYRLPDNATVPGGFAEIQESHRINDACDGTGVHLIGATLLCLRGFDLEVYSLEDPQRPRHITTEKSAIIPSPKLATRGLVHDKHLYVMGPKWLVVFDVSKPDAPRFVKSVESGERGWNGGVSGNVLLVGDGAVNFGSDPNVRKAITAFDISSPASPKKIGATSIDDFVYHILPTGDKNVVALFSEGAQAFRVNESGSLSGAGAKIKVKGRTGVIVTSGAASVLMAESHVFDRILSEPREIGTFPGNSYPHAFPYTGATSDTLTAIPGQKFVTILRAKPVMTARSTASVAVPQQSLVVTTKPGTWIKLLDTKMEPTDPAKVKLTDGVLELNDTSVKFPEIRAKDIILRAKVKKVSGATKHLTLSVRHSGDECYHGFHWFNPAQQGFGVAKWMDGNWKDLATPTPGLNFGVNVPAEFTDMATEVRGNALKFSVNDKVVATGTDSTLSEGVVSISCFLSNVQFKDLEVMILDAAKANTSVPSNAAGVIAPANPPIAATGTRPIITNSIGMKLALIPAGQFSMGSPASEAARRKDEVQHQVTLTKPYLIGVYEVTQAEYRRVMGSNPSAFQGDDLRPVEKVNWGGAHSFCKRLSDLAEEKAKGRRYRLPTDAEWEYACRAGTTTAFSDNATESRRSFREPFLFDPKPVGQGKPNPWGLYDMHSNVWEWCEDHWSDLTATPATDPLVKNSLDLRAIRGGGFDEATNRVGSAERRGMPHFVGIDDIGLRVVCEPSAAELAKLQVAVVTPAVQPTPPPKAGVRLADAKSEKLLIAGGRHSWAMTEDNKKVLTGTFEGDVEVWDAETGAKLHTFAKHDEWVASITCSPTEPHIAFIAGYASGNIRRLDLNALTSEKIYSLSGAATSLSVSRDGQQVLVATGGKRLHIFDAKSGERVADIPGARAPACFRPDDSNVVFFTRTDSTNTITEWNLNQRKEVRRYTAPAPGFSYVAASPDGQRLAVGCGNIPYANGKGPIDQIYVWSTANGDKLATLPYENTKFGSNVAFSADGKSVWAGGATTVQFDIATGERLSTVKLSGTIQCFKDGRRVLVGDSSGIHLCRLREVEVAAGGSPTPVGRVARLSDPYREMCECPVRS